MRSTACQALLVVAALVAGCTCNPGGGGGRRGEALPVERDQPPIAQRQAPGGAQEVPEFAGVVGGLTFRAEEPFLPRRVRSPMRAAEYAVRGHPEAELAVFHFDREQGGGGSVEDNVQRWVDQFEQPDGRPSRAAARVERVEVSGIPVTLVDVGGTFIGMRGVVQRGPPRPGWRMLGAIAEGGDGMVFFKLIGSELAVEEAEAAFRALVESIRRAS